MGNMPEDTADIMGERIPVDPFGTAPEPGQHLHHQEKRLFEARQRWSLDVARRAVGGVVGREVKEREELGEALREIKSERLRGYAKAFSLINDREITGIDGRRRLLEEARRLRELTEEEVLEGKDYQLAEKLQQAISRRLSRFEEPIKPPEPEEAPAPRPPDQPLEGLGGHRTERGKRGAGWLYEDPQELDSTRSAKLRRMIESLEETYQKSPNVLTVAKLRDRYLQIEDWKINEEVDPDEAEEFQSRLGKRLNELQEKQKQELLPKTKDEWIKTIRDQLQRDMKEKQFTTGQTWLQALKISRLKVTDEVVVTDLVGKLREYQPEIANEEISYEFAGKEKKKKFADLLEAEVLAVEALHKRHFVWQKAAPSIKSYGEILDLMQAEGSFVDPDDYEALVTLIPNPGEAEDEGDKVNKSFSLYRRIARRLPIFERDEQGSIIRDAEGRIVVPTLERAAVLKTEIEKKVETETSGIQNKDRKEIEKMLRRMHYGLMPNVFSDFMSGELVDEVRKQVREILGKDEYADEIGFRLVRVWGEASWGDDRVYGPAAPLGDSTVRLMWFEEWRKKEFHREPITEGQEQPREGGPKNTLEGAYPKRIFAPMFRLIKYDGKYVSHLIDEGRSLRDIDFARVEGKDKPDTYFLVKLRHAVLLYNRLTDVTGEGVDSIKGFMEFNGIIERAIHDEIIQVELDSDQGEERKADYWEERKEELEQEVKKWRHDVAFNYLRGLRWAMTPPNGGMSKMQFWEKVVLNAENANTITRGEGDLISGASWIGTGKARLKRALGIK